MNNSDVICPKCGSLMTQTGSDSKNVGYHCQCCGHNAVIAMTTEENAEYWHARQELLHRVRMGVLEWQTAPWDYLSRDIVAFMSRNERASNDVSFKMATIACITHGFRNMTKEKYKECAAIFKMTERSYKKYIKTSDDNCGFENTEDVNSYRDYRKMYKKCRNEYRNTKILWKIAFALAKKLIKPF